MGGTYNDPNAKVVVPNDVELTIVPQNGPYNPYIADQSITVTFMPADAEHYVEVSFVRYDLEEGKAHFELTNSAVQAEPIIVMGKSGTEPLVHRAFMQGGAVIMKFLAAWNAKPHGDWVIRVSTKPYVNTAPTLVSIEAGEANANGDIQFKITLKETAGLDYPEGVPLFIYYSERFDKHIRLVSPAVAANEELVIYTDYIPRTAGSYNMLVSAYTCTHEMGVLSAFYQTYPNTDRYCRADNASTAGLCIQSLEINGINQKYIVKTQTPETLYGVNYNSGLWG